MLVGIGDLYSSIIVSHCLNKFNDAYNVICSVLRFFDELIFIFNVLP